MTRRWFIGLVVGSVAGVCSLVVGPIGGFLGLAAVGLAVAQAPRGGAISGVLLGFGGAWLALFGRIAVTCREDCVTPDLTPWLLAAAGLAGLGILIAATAVIRDRH